MSYFKRPTSSRGENIQAPRQLRGVGAVPDGTTCDPGTIWSDYYSSCVNECPEGQTYNASGICVPLTAPGVTPPKSSGSTAGKVWDALTSIFGSKPASPPTVVHQGGGISATTLAIGGAAVLAVVLIASRRK